MGKLTFTSTRSEFNRKHGAFKEMVMAHMSMDIEVAIKTSSGTPVKTGNMKSQVRHFKAASNKYRVEADAAYSAYQERGARADGSYRVRRYTTPGTSAGWFLRAIEGVLSNRNNYIQEAKKALNL